MSTACSVKRGSLEVYLEDRLPGLGEPWLGENPHWEKPCRVWPFRCALRLYCTLCLWLHCCTLCIWLRCCTLCIWLRCCTLCLWLARWSLCFWLARCSLCFWRYDGQLQLPVIDQQVTEAALVREADLHVEGQQHSEETPSPQRCFRQNNSSLYFAQMHVQGGLVVAIFQASLVSWSQSGCDFLTRFIASANAPWKTKLAHHVQPSPHEAVCSTKEVGTSSSSDRVKEIFFQTLLNAEADNNRCVQDQRAVVTSTMWMRPHIFPYNFQPPRK